MDHVKMAGDTGFEPVNDGVKVRCLTAWRIPNVLMERVKRIELSQPAWKAGALPLSYTRKWMYILQKLFVFNQTSPFHIQINIPKNKYWWREKDSNLRNLR